ncbi:zf-HC2 domain-containing protein [Massilia violaceinigra]|uniref:Zf-HC2 domain-containing protein n=1 Tax=Massilia violaceinigra TaxID=2045208 RepID=A0ABY4A3X8_9BURK|nr:zf-HC2 domain-containing protein [Massilia violaceinigra]UOD29478.1 zf-HC2 domain-containing protein [Massilia violaceinigra]
MNLNQEPTSASHQAMRDLLPWFANGTLDESEAAEVRAHLQHCTQCAGEVAWQRQLHAAAPCEPSGRDPERALARLMPRLGPQNSPQNSVAPARASGMRAWFGGGWMPWAMAGQCALITVLVIQMIAPVGKGDAYQALSNAAAGPTAAPAGTIVVVFQPEASLREVQRLLQASGARVVDGPTVTGAFVLSAPPGGQSTALAVLRADADVQLAEALGPRSAP